MKTRLLASALLLAASPLAAAEVRFLTPPAGYALFGDVEVELALDPAGTPCDRLELYFDGRRVGVFDRAPYRIVVNAGQDNLPHRLEAVAYHGGTVVAGGSLQSPKIYTDEEITVDLHHVYASVTRQGDPVVGLLQDDFTVIAGGNVQKIATFEAVEVPFTAVLLLDTSLSMEGDRLEVARRGAQSFLLAMGKLDEIKLVFFGDRIRSESPFTNVPAVLGLGLTRLSAAGGTALSDALYVALQRLAGRKGRKVVLLVSDGIDIESVLGMEDVRREARRLGVLIEWLRVHHPEDENRSLRRFSIWRNPTEHQRELDLLEKTVNETGGRIEPIDRLDQVEGILSRIVRELRNTYVLGFYPQADGEGKVEVRVRGSGYRVRTQLGTPRR
jgi:VWFA-related protein